MNQQTIVLYQAYGSKKIYHQVLFSILTLYYHLQGNFSHIKVVVYTDNISFFKHLQNEVPIVFEPLMTLDLIHYKGPNNFIHRVKICIIEKCFQKYNSNILYLDSDTYFTENPEQLFKKIDSGRSIMNSDDYDLHNAAPLYENYDWLKIRQAIKNYSYALENGIEKIPLTTRMWNAGVIGISINNSGLMAPILNLADQIYKNVKVFTAEQFAFSYYLQNKTTITSSGNTIFHYWPNHTGQLWKDAYSNILNTFFNNNKSKSVRQFATLAFELTLQHHNIINTYKPSKISKILNHIKLVVQVATKGKV